MTLELAENALFENVDLEENGLGEVDMRNYIFIPNEKEPSGGHWVNVEVFQNLPDAKFDAMLEYLAPFQPMSEDEEMEEGGLGAKGKRAAKLAKKQSFKDEKKAARVDKKKMKNEILKGRADNKFATAEQKRAGTFKGGLNSVIDKIGGVVGDVVGSGKKGIVSGGIDFDIPGPGGGDDGGGGGDEPEKGFLEKNWMYILGGVVVVGGGALLLSKKKKK